MKLIIVSNRLPVTLEESHGKLRFVESIGGLATGVNSYLKSLPGNVKSLWIGWPGKKIVEAVNQRKINDHLHIKHSSCAVYLNDRAVENYYNGFCNQTLWPMLHGFDNYMGIESNFWDSYIAENKHFANVVARSVKPDDVIWIHDFHLMLLPKYLRQLGVTNKIGFFWHVPFPESFAFEKLPLDWRCDLIQGINGADLIGFHTKDYRENFESVSRKYSLKNAETGVFPIGIDYGHFSSAFEKVAVKKYYKNFKKLVPDKTKVLLSVDRLDYIKGLTERLESFQLFLEKYPDQKEKVTLVSCVVPSRETIKENTDLRDKYFALVNKINSQFETKNWKPVQSFYQRFTFEELAALYNLTDVALVTPLIDGMNLVAKEFLAARKTPGGVLVLSKFAGASKELAQAIIVDPKNIETTAEAIQEALTLSKDEAESRKTIMQTALKQNTIRDWAGKFIFNLSPTFAAAQEIFMVPVYNESN